MRVLITGCCGFVARALIEELSPAHGVVLFDRVAPHEATMFGGANGRTPAPFATELPCFTGEITDPEALRPALEGAEAVVHLAADPTGHAEQGISIFRDNALGTYTVLDLARRAGARRFLCASSINAFGTFYWRLSGRPVEWGRLPLTESFAPVPEDPYSLSKLVNEETCAAFHRAYGLTTAAFRFAGVSSDQRYAERVGNLQPTTAWDETLWQWVHVRDVARGLRQALECGSLPGHGVYTLAAADTCAREATMDLLERFRPDLAMKVTRPLLGRESLLCTRRAREAFAYAPQYRLGE
jgi:nucleoside-diphosphate-sugar epimerase